MKKIIFSIFLLSALIGCAPQQMIEPNVEINDETTNPISPDFETDSETEDGMTRPIAPAVEDVEIDYAQLVWDTLYECFLSYVAETEEPNTFISGNGTKIRIVEQEKYRSMTQLSEADKANGIMWEGDKWINIIHLDDGTGEWKDHRLYWRTFRYYDNGEITSFNVWDDYSDFSCDDMSVADANILYK